MKLIKYEQNNSTVNIAHFPQKSAPDDIFFQEIVAVEQALINNNFMLANQYCQQILAKEKCHSKAIYYLAIIAAEFDKFEQATKLLETGLQYSPKDINLWRLMTLYMSQKCSYDFAIFSAKKLIQLQLNNASNWLLIINSYEQSGQYLSAIEYCFDALKISTFNNLEKNKITLTLAHLQKAIGDRDACEKNYQACCSNIDTAGDAYWGLANLKNYDFTQAELDLMQKHINSEFITPEQKSKLAFSIAKAFEDNQEYKLSFRYYQMANEAKEGNAFNINALNSEQNAIVSTFNQTNCLTVAQQNNDLPIPIFIVGIPRSGSTLLEQILANHSAIESTMELLNIPNLIRRLKLRALNQKQSFDELINNITPQALAKFGRSYLEETKIFRTEKKYFIDKLPANFKHIGLISKILPQALIIDIRRDPVACGFSNYKQDYPHGHEYSYQLDNFVCYYQFYLAIMNHWKHILADKVFYLTYESLIQDTEQQVKNILAYCQLPFETKCLEFYKGKNHVYTSSSEQVRQPITNKTDDHWKNFHQHLSVLTSAFQSKESS